jgi:acyl-CoA synthetase (AMP-forming)/AMP-acid ligase II/acyl carrier protein
VNSSRPFSNLVELIQHRAEANPGGLAYEMLSTDGGGREAIDFARLERKARAVGTALAEVCRPGDRALMLYPSGIDFIAAFLGCLYAGVIGVPLYPPRRNKHLERIVAVMKDCTPTAVLTTSASLELSHALIEELHGAMPVKSIATDILAESGADTYRCQDVQDLAFLQYTSGSTGQPKGVMVTHANLLHNLASMHRGFGLDSSARMVSWLPIHHDLGLIFGVLLPLYGGFPASLLPSSAFIQRPYLWLEAVTQMRATITGGPNFAFDLCVDTISTEEKAQLDLSSLRSVLNGAEPVRATTIRRFADCFADCGFRAEAVNPCYGMAEATLVISMNHSGTGPSITRVVSAALEQHRVEPAGETGQPMVGCGQSFPDQKIAVVDPETLQPCPPNRVGEVWVSGPSVAVGYWGSAELSAEAFAARIVNGDGTHYLRTGDLAFLRDGELVITGRLKDLIIIRGRNHYPQDIEHTVSGCWLRFRPGRCAAFTMEEGGEDKLVVVQEVERVYRDKVDIVELGRSVAAAVSEVHELSLAHLVLVRPATVPVTSSGKIQRRLTRRMLTGGELSLVAEWRRSTAAAEPAPAAPGVRVSTRGEIETMLRTELARHFNLPPHQLPDDEPFARFGLDSFIATTVAGSLNKRLGIVIEANFLYDYPTLKAAATWLSARLGLSMPESDTAVPGDGKPLLAMLDWIEQLSEDETAAMLIGNS